MNEQNAWIDIITKLYRDLHMSDVVMHTSSESDKKRDRVLNYFERLERVHNKVVQSKSPSALAKLKEFYYDMYVIKPENIPDKFFENEERIRRENGQGHLTLDEKNKLIAAKIDDQKKSLEKWIDYFLFDEDAKSYEMWEKYWVFQGLQQLGKRDKENNFSKRDKTTVYPFPPVEREVIAATLHLMEEYIKDKKGEDEIRAALGSGNFKTLYEYSLKQIKQKGRNTTQGKWVKYNQGSDYKLLFASLQEWNTGWCIETGENYAKDYLAEGDFYIYYTLDENNEPKKPRIAIRMEGQHTIVEIRGIADNQNMEPEMMGVLNEKLEKFPDRYRYYKKEYDMQRLTSIDKKVKKGIELGKDDLEFLYEVNDDIEGFGNDKDPRIKEIKQGRNVIDDFKKIFENVNEFEGNVNLDSLESAEGLVFPEIINGYLNLSDLESARGLVLPKTVEGYLDLSSLKSAEGLVLPEHIGGELDLSGLQNAESLVLPKTIKGSLALNGLISARDLVLPERIEGNLFLIGLTSARGLILPRHIGRVLDLSGLEIAEGLTLPEYIGSSLGLNSLTSAVDLELPKEIHGCLYLNSLKSAKGLVLPETIDRELYLDSLTSAEGLELPNDFPLERLICSENVKNEIMANPEKYYRQAPVKENELENIESSKHR